MRAMFGLKGVKHGLVVMALWAAVFSPAGAANAKKQLSAHVVVQFTESINNPSASDFIDDLATRVGAPLVYLRPTGRGHLLLIRHLSNAGQFDQVLSAMSTDQSIVTVHPRGKLEPERQ